MSSPEVPEVPPYVAEGARLAAEGRAVEAEVRETLADALLAVLRDEAELARLHPASARDAVDYLVRLGLMTADEGDVILMRAKGEKRGTG
jgi:plasmid stability protein